MADDAWIFCRKSNVTADAVSIADQAERGRESCAEHGWHVAGVLSEEKSASRYGKKQRDAWAELQRLVRDGKVPVLILWESNRGDRTLTTWSAFLDLCRDQGTRIYIISHERLYNPANHRDWKSLATDGVDSAYFSEQLSVVVRRGKRLAMSKGRPACRVPYGYEVHYDEKTGKSLGWRVIPGRAEVAREIRRRVARMEPVEQIRADLISRGIPAPNGGEWGRSTIKQLAVNPAFAGLVALGDGQYAERRQQVDKEGNPTGEEWPPLWDRADWEAARAALGSRATGPRPGAVRHLLAGIAKCECGGWLRGASGAKTPGYACRNSDLHVIRPLLDDWVRDVLCETLSLDDARDMFLHDDSPRVAVLEGELRELAQRRSGFRLDAALGKLTSDALAEIEEAIDGEAARRQRELAASRTSPPLLAEAIMSGDVRAWWDDQELQGRREVIASVTSVTVLRVPRKAGRAAQLDWASRVVFDWKPQPPKRGPGGRLAA